MATPLERQDLAKQFKDTVLKLEHFLEKAGYPANQDEIVRAWATYSESMCATWLDVSHVNQEVLDTLMTHISNFRNRRDEWLLMIGAAEDGSGDAIVRISPEMLNAFAWSIGDVLMSSVTEDGALLVERSEQSQSND